jgi:hypothetical protein
MAILVQEMNASQGRSAGQEVLSSETEVSEEARKAYAAFYTKRNDIANAVETTHDEWVKMQLRAGVAG